MRSLYSLLLGVLMLTMTVPSWAFSDTQQYWAQPAIDRVSNKSIIGGYPDGSFRPNGAITRAEFSAILMKAANLSPMPASQSPFVDVPTQHWAFPAINAAKSAGLVSGFPGGMFYPSRTISRVEALAMLANGAKLPMPSDAEANQILAGYNDAASVPAWARRAVAASLKAGMLNQFPNTAMVMPTNEASRGEVAAMVDNFTMVMAGGMPMNGQQMAGNTPGMMNPNMPNGQMTNNGQMMNGQPMGTNPAAMQGYVATVAQGTAFTATLTSAVSSETAKAGDPVTLTLDAPIVGNIGGQSMVVVPQGATISGMVRTVEPSGRTGKNGLMEMDFTAITLPNGSRIPMMARIATESGVLEGDSTRNRALKALGKTALGAGAGAALGTAMGPLSGGKVGKGAIYGTAVGAGLGAATALVQKGKDVTLQPGQQLQLQLLQNMTVGQ
jgi:S-layer homology domain